MFLSRILVLFYALSISGYCFSQDWYEIEVIIFEHSAQTQAQQSVEIWPSELDLNWPTPLLELEPAVEREEQPAVKPPFEELVFDERRMNNESYALRVRDPYELLWHKAWRAPLLPEDQAPWILVQASEQIGDHYRLEGAIRIHLSRYLHLHSDLWLTEVSGEPIIEVIAADEDSTGLDVEIDLSEFANIELESEFDWSQLPEPSSVRWGCNHVRELWPEDKRLLPADYYDDPAPADWYYPFSCRIPSENPDLELPLSVSLPTSDRFIEDELELHYPELMEAEMAQTEAAVSELTDLKKLADGLKIPAPGRSLPIQPEELFSPEPKISYQVDEIVHIKGQRRMRSGEFHYIDHPKIGILALINPVEKPELELEPELETTETVTQE